jgi:sugar phosphate isomerase/epimerase
MIVGISSINGAPLPMAERFRLFREAGFGAVLLWWGDGEAESREQRVRLAEKYGLAVENVHASTDRLNELWADGPEGDRTIARIFGEIEDCARLGIATIVLHLTNGINPPPVSNTGAVRIESLVERAKARRVRLAFENVRLPEHTCFALDRFQSPYVGLCYDSGHEHRWTPEIDWLSWYGGRTFALHLHDNAGDRDAHLTPYLGSIDWDQKITAIAKSCYRGAPTLEAEYDSHCAGFPCTLEEFLRKARGTGTLLGDRIEGLRAQTGIQSAR